MPEDSTLDSEGEKAHWLTGLEPKMETLIDPP